MIGLFGSSGYLGADTARILQSRCEPFIRFVRGPWRLMGPGPGAVRYNLRAAGSLVKMFKKMSVDRIIFLSSPRSGDFSGIAVGFLAPMMAFLGRLKSFHVIYASSQVVYGKQEAKCVREDASLFPSMAYDYEKIIMEKALFHHPNISSVCLRIPILFSERSYHPESQIIDSIFGHALKGLPFAFSDSKQKAEEYICSWLHNEDFALRAITLLNTWSAQSDIFNIASGKFRFLDLLRQVIRATQSKSEIVYDYSGTGKKTYIIPRSFYQLDTQKLDKAFPAEQAWILEDLVNKKAATLSRSNQKP